MDFALDESQQAARDLAAQIMGELSPPDRLRALERAEDPAGAFDAELWAALAEAGLLGIAMGEDVGGAGLDFVALSQLCAVAGDTAALVPVVESLVMAADTIDRFGSSEQRAEWLPRIASGDLLATAATAELVGDAIVDGLSAPATSATRVDGGWRLEGTKACVASGLRAELLLVPATTPEGPAIFLVDAAGLAKERQDGPARPEAVIELDVVVGDDRLLGGDAAKGAEQLASLALRTTSALCSFEGGVVTAALKLGAEYTSEREQFDRKIATFQAVGQRLGDAYVDAEAIRLTALQSAWRIASGLDAEAETAIAKFWAADGGQRVVHASTHVHGGVGVDRDYPLHRYFLLTRQVELTLGGATKSLLALGSLS